jgi:hypothetical protein
VKRSETATRAQRGLGRSPEAEGRVNPPLSASFKAKPPKMRSEGGDEKPRRGFVKRSETATRAQRGLGRSPEAAGRVNPPLSASFKAKPPKMRSEGGDEFRGARKRRWPRDA